MKWDVKLFVAGSMFTEQVHATKYARCSTNCTST